MEGRSEPGPVSEGEGSPVQHRRCSCTLKLDAEEPIVVVKREAGNTTTFKPHLDEDHECTDKENCRTEKLWKWTVEKLSGDATLTDDDHEVVSVRAKAGARFKLCVTVTYKCWARVEPINPPSEPTAGVSIVAKRCEDTGCSEFELT